MRRALQSENVAEACIPARLANRPRANRDTAGLLLGDGSGIFAVSAPRSSADSQQCAHRKSAVPTRSALCVAWNLGAFRYAMVPAHRGARLRPAHGGNFLPVVS